MDTKQKTEQQSRFQVPGFKFRVLFVNPDQKLVQIHQTRLADHFSVDSANNGLAALRSLKAKRPALVVSDYDLPWLSGLSLLKFMRRAPEYAVIPFIFLTDRYNTHEALSFGANDYLSKKQTSPDFLLAKIYFHLRLNPHGIQIY